jgi:predicted permease
VVAQVSLTVVLLAVSGLLTRSLGRLQGVETGFDPQGLLTAEVPLPAARYQDVGLRARTFSDLRERIAAIPGVEAVGVTSALPIRDPGNNVRIATLEAWGGDASRIPIAYQRMVLPGYFQTLGVPVLAGRDVALTDDRTAPPVVLLSESLASTLFPDGSALGRVVGVDVGGDEPLSVEVVGVVGDVASASLYAGRDAAMYFSYVQRTPALMRLAVRVRGNAASVAPGMRAALRELDPDVPLNEVATMDEVLAASVSDRRAVVLVLGVFAAIALLLSAVGVYGVLAYQVSRRTREIGVRMALGATVGGISRDVVTSGLRLVAVGLALGLPASLLAARLVRGMLFEVGSADPVTYASVTLFFAAVGTVACWLPAHRAARVDPAAAFRAE